MAWFGAIEHERWLSAQLLAVLDHGHKAYLPGGFGYIGPEDRVDPDRPLELALTARSTYIYALGTLMGIPGSRRRCDHGVKALTYFFKDAEFGGWFAAIKPLSAEESAASSHGEAVTTSQWCKDSRSMSYVLQAAAAATVANRPGAHELLMEACQVEEDYFWDEAKGLVNDGYTRDFSELEPYHGLSSNLRAVEAFLDVADATGNDVWLERALKIVSFVIKIARDHSWRIPEHFDAQWNIDKNYNVGHPADPHRPYGINIGHCLAWSRVILQALSAARYRGMTPPEGLLEAAQEIFERARTDAWRRDGKSGFFFTVDYEGKSLVRQRFAWVVAEGVQAAVAMRRALLDAGASEGDVEHYEHCYRSWLDFCEGYLIMGNGRWLGELNPHNEADGTVWPGSPDVFHPAKALLLPRLPLAPTIPVALAQDLIDKADVNAPKTNGEKTWALGVLRGRLGGGNNPEWPRVPRR